MARPIHRLNARQCKTAPGPVKLCDGGGLWLYISPSGARNWVYRYRLNGRDREMGLGALPEVSLADARGKASDYRKLRAGGTDPITHKRANKQTGKTFGDCAEACIESHRASWKNAKHAQQWQNTLAAYAIPKIGKLPVNTIDTEHVLSVLKPIWTTKTETATRVRQRIEAVLDWAAARGYRHGENPARWRGHLKKLLAEPTKIKMVQHHPALPYPEISDFMRDLRTREGLSAAALEFSILTACRTNEVLGATWDEIDFEAATWTIPGERMKARRSHRVPLTAPALKLLTRLNKTRSSDYVFPGQKYGRPLSNMAMLSLLKRQLGRPDLTVHGFRSTFRDWCAETTNFPREVAEAALAHVLTDKTEAAYQRGDLFEKRRALMEAWARHCSHSNRRKVVSIHRQA